MDDANAPSLLSIPLIGSAPPSDPTYRATRRLALTASASLAHRCQAG